MPAINSCGCCSLLQGCIITGVYTGVVYMAAFIMELCLVLNGENWINSGRNRGSLPLPEYILVVLHFTVVGLAIIMLFALYQRRTGVMLAWVVIGSLLLFPEVGIILYLVMFYWDFTNVIGMAELIFYSVRGPVNVVCIICIYTLYSTWKNQTETQRSLKKLTNLQVMKDSSGKPLSYKNAGYLGSASDLSMSGVSLGQETANYSHYGRKYGTIPVNRSRLGDSMTSLDMEKGGSLYRGYSTASQFSNYRNYFANPHLAQDSYSGYRNWDPYIPFPYKDNRSEFNASIFPTQAGNMGSMPALSHTRSEHTIIPYSGMMFNTVNLLGTSLNYPPDYGGRNGGDFYDPRLISNSLLDPEYASRLAYNQPITHQDYATQSLDRRRYLKRGQSLSMEPFNQGPHRPYRGHPYHGYPRHKNSKTSLGAESDDFRRYRDVAL